MTISDHVDSYYAASANSAPDHPPVQGAYDCDVCVIGAGLTGCSAALELANRGYQTAVIEAERVGWGASGRSGGQAIFGYACEQTKIRKLVGREDARRLWAMSVEAMTLLKERIASYRIDCDYRPGQMHAAIKPRQHRELLAWKEELEDEYHYDSLRMVEGDELASLMDTRRYVSGLLDTASGHLHPLNLTLGLSAAAREAGARFFEKSPALAIREGDPVRVTTPDGEIRCRYLLLCGNAYLGSLSRRIRSRVMPVGTYIIATEQLDHDLARSLIANDMAVADVNFVLDYYRLSADKRMLFGGRVSYSTIPPPSLPNSIRARMVKVYPQLKDVPVEFAWGGNVAITMNRAPDIGRVANNVFYAQGFSGHGIVTTGFAGKVLAEAVAGTAERLDVFARIPHRPFPGGQLLRMPALVLAMAYYRIRDLL
jgi:gamma-glutamylputrescine oxidase